MQMGGMRNNLGSDAEQPAIPLLTARIKSRKFVHMPVLSVNSMKVQVVLVRSTCTVSVARRATWTSAKLACCSTITN